MSTGDGCRKTREELRGFDSSQYGAGIPSFTSDPWVRLCMPLQKTVVGFDMDPKEPANLQGAKPLHAINMVVPEGRFSTRFAVN